MKINNNTTSSIFLFISILITIVLCIALSTIKLSLPSKNASIDPIYLNDEEVIENIQEIKNIQHYNSEFIHSNVITKSGILSKGESLYLSLKQNHIEGKTIHFITSKISPLFNFRKKSRPGDRYKIIQDPNRYLISFEYRVNTLESYILKRNKNDQWEVKRKSVTLDKYWIRICGEIQGSLFASFADTYKGGFLAAQYANIFAWKIDFHHESRNGDKFALVVEKFTHNNEFICYGNILAAVYDGCSTGKIIACYFDEKYYSPDGRSLIQPFLRTPLNYKYISSGYTYRRLHPILGRVKPHLAIDFAAPSGTPIWAVADGKVIAKKYDPYNGKQIILRHTNGNKTYYNHCSSFAKGIYVGAKVKQKQTIAYVGTTGLSTGPHLDYRVKKNGKYVNPLTIQFPKGSRLTPTKLPKLKQCFEAIKPVLDGEKDYDNVIVASIDSSNL